MKRCSAAPPAARERDPAGALEAGLTLLDQGWLSYRCPAVAEEIEPWLARARELKLPRRTQQRASSALEACAKGREQGFAAFVRALAELELGEAHGPPAACRRADSLPAARADCARGCGAAPSR